MHSVLTLCFFVTHINVDTKPYMGAHIYATAGVVIWIEIIFVYTVIYISNLPPLQTVIMY
jgi:hypothetical protein